MKAKRWKSTERGVAEYMGGERTSNAGLGSAVPDVETPAYSVEVKDRAALPAWLTGAMAQAVRNCTAGKMPLVVWHEKGNRRPDDLVMVRLGDFVQWFGEVLSGE